MSIEVRVGKSMESQMVAFFQRLLRYPHCQCISLLPLFNAYANLYLFYECLNEIDPPTPFTDLGVVKKEQ